MTYIEVRVWTGGENAVCVMGIDEHGEPHDLWSTWAKADGSATRALAEQDAWRIGRRYADEHGCECVEDES